MKDNKKYIIYLLLLLVFVICVLPFTTQAEENVVKGTLRCPPQFLNNGCVEIVENGEVVETRVTGNVNGATITKIVRKTNTPGQLTVRFEAHGQTQRVYGDAYIVVILDASTTMGSKYVNFAVPAAKNFAKSFDPVNNHNIHLAEVSFYGKILTSRSFETNDFEGFDFKKGNKVGSNLYLALNKSMEFFQGTSIPEGAKKFVVILGDGHYIWSRIENSDGYKYLKDPANDVTIYSIGWGDAKESQYAQQMIDIAGSADRYVYAGEDADSYMGAFNSIYNMINPIVENNVVTINITDSIGEYFSSINGNAKYKTFTSNTSPYNTEPFIIQIDGSAPNGWHNTNKWFEFNNNQININPEIYWEQEREDWKYCSDTLEASKLVANKTNYYTISCKQEKFLANLKVDNQPIETTKFNISNGRGFPVSIDISSSNYCIYEFNTQSFKNDYEEIIKKYNEKMNEYNRTHSQNALKEAASYEKERISMANLLDGYNKNSSNVAKLSEYEKSFGEQKAKLTIKYYDNSYQDVFFIDSSNISDGVKCYNDRQENILGNNIYTYRTCYLNNSKTFNLPVSCISMKTGEAVNCSNENNLLNGGNEYYVSSGKKGGYLSITLDKATLFGGDVKLEGEKQNSNNPKCEFTIGNLDKTDK